MSYINIDHNTESYRLVNKSDPNSPSVQKGDEQPSKPKKIKPEDKPFKDFILQELIPTLQAAIKKHGLQFKNLELIDGTRPVVGGKCWMIKAQLENGRRIWLCFDKEDINSKKTIALSEQGIEPSTLESFLIDERKSTLQLLSSRFMQRLHGQKWLSAN